MNEEPVRADTIKVDLSDPVAELKLSPASPDGSEGYYISEPLVTLSSYGPDPGSDVLFYYRISGGSVQEY